MAIYDTPNQPNQSLHARRGLTYHIANTFVSGRYCIRNEQQGGLAHI